MGERPRELGADSASGGGAGVGYTVVSRRQEDSGAITLPGAPPLFLEKSPRLLGHLWREKGEEAARVGAGPPLPRTRRPFQ